MNWEIVTQTHVGNVRQVNEDSFTIEKEMPLMAVADGMGGMYAGEIASQIITNNLSKVESTGLLAELESVLQQSLQTSNADILAYSKDKLNGKTAGSTVVAFSAIEDRGICLWAGDSRLYRLRNLHLEQITNDHSQIAELISNGLISKEEAKTHASRNVITRAVGVRAPLVVDSRILDIQPNDTYLLCSDGLYNEVEDREIRYVLNNRDIYRSSVRLLNLCLQRGARDNVTFIIGRASTLDSCFVPDDETLADITSTQKN